MASELKPIEIAYTNYRGETSLRTITPQRVWFGSTEWHPEPQWLVTAYDHDKQAVRDFAFKDFCRQEPSAARELALEEILREVDEIERKVWAWSGSAFLNNELEGAEDADCKTELYSELCGIGNTMHWLRAAIRALSSPDHADAGKVEGDGWQPIESAPKDGTVILVYREDAGVFTAHYVEEDAHLSSTMNPPEGDFYWFSTAGDDLTNDMPTHWRHLPLAPASEGTSNV